MGHQIPVQPDIPLLEVQPSLNAGLDHGAVEISIQSILDFHEASQTHTEYQMPLQALLAVVVDQEISSLLDAAKRRKKRLDPEEFAHQLEDVLYAKFSPAPPLLKELYGIAYQSLSLPNIELSQKAQKTLQNAAPYILASKHALDYEFIPMERLSRYFSREEMNSVGCTVCIAGCIDILEKKRDEVVQMVNGLRDKFQTSYPDSTPKYILFSEIGAELSEFIAENGIHFTLTRLSSLRAHPYWKVRPYVEFSSNQGELSKTARFANVASAASQASNSDSDQDIQEMIYNQIQRRSLGKNGADRDTVTVRYTEPYGIVIDSYGVIHVYTYEKVQSFGDKENWVEVGIISTEKESDGYRLRMSEALPSQARPSYLCRISEELEVQTTDPQMFMVDINVGRATLNGGLFEVTRPDGVKLVSTCIRHTHPATRKYN